MSIEWKCNVYPNAIENTEIEKLGSDVFVTAKVRIWSRPSFTVYRINDVRVPKSHFVATRENARLYCE